MDKLKFSIDLIKRNHKLISRKNSCDAIDESVIESIRIFADRFIECTCDVCGLKYGCDLRLSKDCKYINELQNKINEIEIKL